jgi:hypothetical protein
MSLVRGADVLKTGKNILLAMAVLLPLSALGYAAAEQVWDLPDQQALEAQAVGRWIELDARRGSRVYVAPTGQQGRDGLPRIHYRHDSEPDENNPTASQVETMDVDCWRGETWGVAMRLYDADSQLTYVQNEEARESERILSFYQSPLAQFCSGEYLIKSLPEGRARWLELLELMETVLEKHRGEVPERTISVPD